MYSIMICPFASTWLVRKIAAPLGNIHCYFKSYYAILILEWARVIRFNSNDIILHFPCLAEVSELHSISSLKKKNVWIGISGMATIE